MIQGLSPDARLRKMLVKCQPEGVLTNPKQLHHNPEGRQQKSGRILSNH